ncbi:MAG TPA: hypothetical protein PKK56_02640 [archaeon]|nr:hypothetical protein [archaeon]
MKSEKAQIMVFDILITLVLVFLVIEVEQAYVFDYNTQIVSSELSLYFLEKNLVVDQLISDCNFLAKYDFISKVCYKNNIQLSSLDKIVFLDPSICKLVLDNKIIYKTQSTIIKTSFTRGVIYNGSFCVLEVDFCE